MTENVKNLLLEYLKENLTVAVNIQRHLGFYSDEKGIKVMVSLDLDGQTVCASEDYCIL